VYDPVTQRRFTDAKTMTDNHDASAVYLLLSRESRDSRPGYPPTGAMVAQVMGISVSELARLYEQGRLQHEEDEGS